MLDSLVHKRVEIKTDPTIKTPPMVGVPRLTMCACGPSSRICCPTFHFFKASISLPPKKSDVLKNVQSFYEKPIFLFEVVVDQLVKDVIDHGNIADFRLPIET